ncbi:hypothetical protein C8Q76DRAFT_801008 [Earliella scabrosa]|nr:hypothetical protein C8Q76DRAFT_801008 [Earliella scabrosa]
MEPAQDSIASTAELAQNNVPQKHDSFWFSDGSIVLVANSTAFRVHTSILTRHSPVFMNIINLPQAEDAKRIDGCPVVHVSDSADEITCLLHAIYDGRKFMNIDAWPVTVSFDTLSALVRLGHKYEFEEIVEEAMKWLEVYYTTNFDVWKKYIRGVRDPPFLISAGPSAHDIDAVNLARLTGNHSILPVALYRCAQLTVDDLLDGMTGRGGRVVALSADDARQCLRAKESLMEASGHVAVAASYITHLPDCSTPGECLEIIQDLHRSLFPLSGDFEITTDPLRNTLWRDWSSRMLHRRFRDLCGECKSSIEIPVKVAQQSIWRELPLYFDLPAFEPGGGLKMVVPDVFGVVDGEDDMLPEY